MNARRKEMIIVPYKFFPERRHSAIVATTILLVPAWITGERSGYFSIKNLKFL